jgi:hypothetical protein
VRESVEALKGAKQTIDARVVGRRDDVSVCVFYAKTIHVDGRKIGAFVLEEWVRGDGVGWRLCRETVEHGVSAAGEPPTDPTAAVHAQVHSREDPDGYRIGIVGHSGS